MPRFFLITLLLSVVSSSSLAFAQEPAFLYDNPALRYEVSPGRYHYVFPCKMRSQANGAVSADSPPAICWPILGGQFKNAKGENVKLVPVVGVIAVSATTVKYLPNEANAASPMPDLPVSEIQYSYDASRSVATLKTSAGTWGFAFRPICIDCQPGNVPPDPSRQQQFAAEYREFQESLVDFKKVESHLQELAANLRIGVTPSNQPNLQDPPEAMALYSDLNTRLSPYCSDSARTCLASYQKYQACKSAGLQAECGEPPSCSTACIITSAQLKALKVTLCESRLQDSATLIPDWSEVAKKRDADRQARSSSDPITIHIKDKDPNAPQLDFMGKPIDNKNPCSVEAAYATAMMTHLMPAPPAVNGSIFGSTPSPGADPKTVIIASGVATGLLISQTRPIYPPAARAARVGGTVVLKATITKQGDIDDLSVVSGPALLQQAALDAVKTWKYRPYMLNGQPVKILTQINVVFNLGGPPPPSGPSAPGVPPQTP